MKRRNAIVLVIVLGLLWPAAAIAQERKREAQLRTVQGTVVDKEEN